MLSFLRSISSALEVRPRLCVLIRASGLDAECALAGLMRPVGPSSSHTVGPMRAGKIFIGDLEALGLLDKVI